jgi:aspartyl-tRNA synthetase
MRRTCYCGELDLKDVGREVVLMGWVHSIRDHGGVTFIDLRDREGIVQVVFNPEVSKEAHQLAQQLGDQYVIAVKGIVQKRPPGTENPRLKTGQIEVIGTFLEILNTSKPPPFPIEDNVEVGEPIRLKYRYLDLRRPSMFRNLLLRHRAAQLIRNYLSSKGFVEVETPFLTKSTPEGARDFLVPSRLNPGNFYALPQSPQLFKQILMIGGIDRYFQIVRCFRDEDLRADRQPEFTQVDIEMSFVQEEDVQEVVEGLLVELFKELLGIQLQTPFPRIPYDEAMERFGTDKPDLRFGMELKDLSDLFKESSLEVLRKELEKGGRVKGLVIEGGARFSRKELDDLISQAISLGAKGLGWIKLSENGWQGPVVKYLPEGLRERLRETTELKVGDLLLFLADQKEKASQIMGELRLRLGRSLGFIKEGKYEFVWIVDFPMFEWDENEGRYVAVHHPFTSPKEEHMSFLETDPVKVKARAYDIVLNGHEIGGGSIRNHRFEIQKKIFQIIGLPPDEAQRRFGFLLEALQYGAPPHGGIALGFDRLVMILCGKETIREVIAFPKTQKGICPLTGAPSFVDLIQLKELHIKLDL